jgi:hypothetical protein
MTIEGSNACQFKEEISQVMKKYGVKLEGYDDYDGEENWKGCHYAFVGPEIHFEVSELEE